VENVVPDAIRSLHAQIIDRNAPGDGDLTARLLERSGVLDGGGAPTYNIEGDLVLKQGLALMPSRPTLPALTIESGAEPPADASPDISEVLTVEERSVAK
jgi:hypothetical protein